MAPLNIEVEYVYILSDWFRKPEYKDTLDYVISVGCQYYSSIYHFKKSGYQYLQNRFYKAKNLSFWNDDSTLF